MLLAAAVSLTNGGYCTIAAILILFVVLLTTKIPVDVAFFGAVIFLLCTGSISVSTAISGFSSPVVVTVGALFFVTAALEATGLLRLVLLRLFGRPKSLSHALVRLSVNVSVLSAFMSNTLIVSMFTPVVKAWARRLRLAPSKLLIPLSYASCMGGICLLIGTPANLVISAFYSDETGQSLNIAAPLVPGLCMILLGTLVTVLLQRLLPTRKTAEDALPDLAKSYVLKVPRESHLVGLTLEEASLPTDDGRIRLTGILRFDGEMSAAPFADDFVMGGDTLYYTGSRRHAAAVARRCGLELPDDMSDTQSARTSPKMMLALGIFLAMVGVSALTKVPLVACALVAAFLMLATRCVSITMAKKAVSWDLLMVFAASVVLGKAVEQSGIAAIFAERLVDWCGSNPRLALTLMCAVASILTEFVSNTACGAVLAPIAVKIASGCGASPLPFVVALMVSCSSSFMTPIGSPTHLIVLMPGGYRFADFLRLGVPLSVISLAVSVFVVPLVFPF